MALIKTWPDSTSTLYDNKQWKWNEWAIGTPITQNKLENLENGVGILATQIKAILGEFNPSSLDGAQLNASRLDNIQEWITGSSDGSYNIGGSGDDIVSRLNTQNDNIVKIRGWIANGSDYQNDYDIDSRLGMIESSIGTIEDKNNQQDGRLDNIETLNGTQDNQIENLENRAESIEDTINDQDNRLITLENELTGSSEGASRLDDIENWITADSGIINRLQSLEDSRVTDENNITTLQNDNDTNKTNINNIITEIYGSDDTSIVSRLDDLETEICGETITRAENGGYSNSRIDGLELMVGNGVIGTDSDISAAIRRLSDTVATLDPTGSAEAVNFLVNEVWGQSFSEDTDFTANSRIDILETDTQNLGTQLTTLATEQNELEQNLAATNAKIPIEMYIATNTSASDTIVLDTTPRDKSIFFIAIPKGTLGTNNLTLQTPDIQFNNVLINRIYNGNGMKIKYSAGSLISIYRNGANAYVYNVPMVL